MLFNVQGIIGTIFVRCNIVWCNLRKTTRIGRHPIIEVAVLMVLTSALSFWNPYTR